MELQTNIVPAESSVRLAIATESGVSGDEDGEETGETLPEAAAATAAARFVGIQIGSVAVPEGGRSL